MSDFLLVLGNKRYSSWSLRGYLALKFAGIDFKEEVIPLFEEGTHAKIQSFASDAPPRVPLLLKDNLVVWDTLSIMEYAAENSNTGSLWPEDSAARAYARSVVAEMHAGFVALRSHIPMNLSRDDAYQPLLEDVQADIDRIFFIWENCRRQYASGGPYLFGRLSMADAAFAPVVSRLKSRSVPVTEICEEYCKAVWDLPAFAEWREAAAREPWIIDQ
ncbi:MAG: glutathione S-transferase [Sneathiella sp.]